VKLIWNVNSSPQITLQVKIWHVFKLLTIFCVLHHGNTCKLFPTQEHSVLNFDTIASKRILFGVLIELREDFFFHLIIIHFFNIHKLKPS
jgi:hypothetical protein